MTLPAVRPRRPFRPSAESLEGRVVLSSAPSLAGPRHAHVVSLDARSGSIRRLANLRYTSGAAKAQALDLYLPAGKAPEGGWPVVLAIHGGGWRQFSKDTYGRGASVLATQGFAVAAPNYTLSRPGHPSWPTNRDELRQAVGWLRAHAATYGLDPARIAAIGESAGGHLAELLGTDTRDPASARIQAVVSFSGPSDLAALCRDSREGAGVAVRRFLGGSAARKSAIYRAASPVDQVSANTAPMLLIHGASDELVPPSQSTAMNRALRAAGVPSRLLIVPGGHELGFRPGGRDLVPTIASFLDQAMKNAPDRTDP